MSLTVVRRVAVECHGVPLSSRLRGRPPCPELRRGYPRVRSRMMFRSNSGLGPQDIVLMRCLRLRPSRSSFQTTSESPGRTSARACTGRAALALNPELSRLPEDVFEVRRQSSPTRSPVSSKA